MNVKAHRIGDPRVLAEVYKPGQSGGDRRMLVSQATLSVESMAADVMLELDGILLNH